MVAKQTTAADMARSVGVDPKAFQQALQDAKFKSHKRNNGGTVQIDSPDYSAMRTVLVTLVPRKRPL